MPNNPYLDQLPEFAPIEVGVKRRKIGPSETPIEGVDPYENNWLGQATRASIGGFENQIVNGLPALGYGVLGLDDQRIDAANDYLKRQEEVRALGPRIQSFEDASDAGGDVGDYLAAAGYMAVDSGIGMGLSLLGGGVGGGLARMGTQRAVRSAAADVLENTVEQRAIKAEARKTAMDAAEKAALARGEAPEMVSAAVKGAAAQTDDTLRRESMKEAARLSGRTPIADGAMNPVQAQARAAADAMRLSRDAATKRGAAIGVTAAGLPQQLDGDFASLAADPNTQQDDMIALGLANTAASALDVLPLERVAGRFAKTAARAEREATQGFGERLARETLGQAAAEGTQEVAQQATQNLGQSYVAGNLDPLVGPAAINEYIGSFIGGAVVGGAMGGAGEVGSTGARKIGQAANVAGEKLKSGYEFVNEKLGDYLSKLRKARLNQQFGSDEEAMPGKRKYKAGERMDPDDAGTDGKNSSVFDFFGKVMNKTKTAATSAFDKAANTLKRADAERSMTDEDRDATASFMAGGGDGQSFAPRDQAYSADKLPAGFAFKTKAQRLGMSMLTPQAWQVLEDAHKTDPDGTYEYAKQIAESFDRLFSSEDALTDEDFALHARLLDAGAISKSSLMSLKTLAGIQNDIEWTKDDSEGGKNLALAPETEEGANGKFSLKDELSQALADPEAGQAEVLDAGGDVMDAADKQQEFTKFDEQEGATDPLGRGPDGSDATPGENIQSIRRTIEEARARLATAQTDDAKAEQQAVLDEARLAQHKAVMDLRQDILGGGAVMQGTFKDEAKHKNDALRADPSRVEMVRKGVWGDQKVAVPQFISLDNLLRRQRARWPHKYYGVVADADVNKAALFDALSEVVMAGIPLDTSTFTAGTLRDNKSGETLLQLTDADVRQLQQIATKGTFADLAESVTERRAAVAAANTQLESAQQAHADAKAALDAAAAKGFKNKEEKTAALAPLKDAVRAAADGIRQAQERVTIAKNEAVGAERAAATQAEVDTKPRNKEGVIKDAPKTAAIVAAHRKKLKTARHQRALNRNARDREAEQDDVGTGIEGTGIEDERHKLGERGRPITGFDKIPSEDLVIGVSGETDVEQEVLDASLQERRDALRALAQKLGVKPSSIMRIEAKQGIVAVVGELAPATVTFANGETEVRKVPTVLLGYSPENIERLKKLGAFTSKNRGKPQLKFHERPLTDRDERVDTREARDDAADQLEDLLDAMLDTVGDKGKAKVMAAYAEAQQEKLDSIRDKGSKQAVAIKLNIRELKGMLRRWVKLSPDERLDAFEEVVAALRKYYTPLQVKEALLGIAVDATKTKHKFKKTGLNDATTMDGETLVVPMTALDKIIVAAVAASDGVENWIGEALAKSGRQARAGNETEAEKAYAKKMREAGAFLTDVEHKAKTIPSIEMLLQAIRRAEGFSGLGVHDVSPETVSTVDAFLQTPEGTKRLLDHAAQLRSEYGLGQIVAALRTIGTAEAAAAETEVTNHAVEVALDMYAAGRELRSRYGNLNAQGVTPRDENAQYTAIQAHPLDLRKTLVELLKVGGGTPAQREVLELFSKAKFLDTLDYEIKLALEQNGGVRPAFDGKRTKLNIEIGIITELGYHELYAHELAHAMTMHAERTDPKLRNDVNNLLNHVRTLAAAKGVDVDAVYGFSNTQEFIAEAFSNPEVQALLRTLPALNTKSFQSAWAEFKDFIQRSFKALLGKSPSPTALDEVITLGIKMGTLNPKTLQPTNPTTSAQAQAAISAAVVSNMQVPTESEKPETGTGFDPTDITSIADFVDNVLGKDERAILDKALRVPANRTRLQELASNFMGQDLRSLLLNAERGPSYTAAVAYVAWKHGKLKLGPKSEGIMAKIAEILKAVFNIASNSDMAHRIFSDMETGRINHLKNAGKSYSVRAIEARKRGWAQTAANKLAEENKFTNAMQSFWTSSVDRMLGSGIPAYRKLAAQLQRPQGTSGAGDSGAIPTIRKEMFEKHRALQNAVEGLNGRQRVLLMSIMQRKLIKGDALYDNASEQVKQAVTKTRALMREMYAASRESGFRFEETDLYFPVMMDMTREGSEAKLTKLYQQPRFRKPLFDLFDIPVNERTAETHARLVKRAVAAATWDGSRSFNTEASANAADADMRSASFNRRFSAFVYSHGTAEDIKTFASLQSKDVDELFARYFSPALRSFDFRSRWGDPAYFDYEPTSADDDDDVEFALRRAARGKLDDLLANAKEQGATERDIKFAEGAVKAAYGVYGQETSPTLEFFSPGAAKKFSGENTKAFIQGAQAYQNARLLPLSLLSSLVDPMGVAVRTGGDFKTAWHGFKAGMKSIMNKEHAQSMLSMLEEISMGDDVLPAIASTPAFDKGNGFARKVNEKVFKWNGMQAWVHSTRVMAVVAGHKFLLKARDNVANGKDPEGHYQRYLTELGLTPKDIVAKPGEPNKVVINDKTRQALSQFIDEAILRPNSQQSPLWYSDPYMGLVTQYKHFGYAIYDQISKRVLNEMSYGNYRIVLAAMAYLPMALMAELLREFIQYAGGGNPNRKDWGAGEYTSLAAERTGLLSPQIMTLKDLNDDRKRGSFPGTSQLGPSGGQALNVTNALQGRRDAGKEFESALPGSAGWRHLNDDTAPAAEAGVQRMAA